MLEVLLSFEIDFKITYKRRKNLFQCHIRNVILILHEVGHMLVDALVSD